MKLLVETVNTFNCSKPLTIFTKSFALDLWQGSEDAFWQKMYQDFSSDIYSFKASTTSQEEAPKNVSSDWIVLNNNN